MINDIKENFEFVAIHYPFYKKEAIRISTSNKTSQQYQKFINDNSIEMAEIIMSDLELLRNCPTLKHLKISPSFDAKADFDFSPLYDAPEIISLNCQNHYGDRNQYISTIHYDKINGLVDLFVNANKGALGFNRIATLKTLRIGGFKGKNNDVSDLFCSRELDTLQLNDCKIQSLKGIDLSSKMQCLYLNYNRSLRNINDLKGVKETLKALRIQNCPKIEDFSVLGELEKLELLELSGNNTLPNLDFLKAMKNLKTFVFNMNVLDGNLTLCLGLSYVYSERNRMHYNLKDAELPKGKYVRGNEDIEEWRRLE